MLRNAVILLTLILPLSGCSQLNSALKSPLALIDARPLKSSDWRALDEQHDPSCYLDPEAYAEYSSPDYEDIWERVRAGFQLEYTDNERIQSHRDWYARNPTYMRRVTERASRYMYAIVEKIEERGLPMELALLPIVESAFDPFAYSHGRAAGMWQFIPSTGLHFGLKQNWWYDGRRDIEASTDAALDYLTSLYGFFDNDWLLALAAYNTGQGNLRRAIRRNTQAGKPTDFWSLTLPRETQAYVPQLLALSQIIAEPERYNVTLNPIPNERYYEVVDVDSQIDLAKAAEMAEMDIEELYLLNPAFNRWATDPNGPHRLLIPVDRSATFRENLALYPAEKRLSWHTYKVARGDTLATIARRFNTTVNTVRDVNRISGSLIREGQTLLIPTATNDSDFYALSAEQRLQQIANRGAGSDRQKVTYTVKRGDSFWDISRRYKVTVDQLARWNGMAPKDPLRVGQTLVIWTQQAAAAPKSPRSGKMVREVAYQVRRGDSLAGIASRFNLSVKDIADWNSLEIQDYIHPGQRLKLLVDITSVN